MRAEHFFVLVEEPSMEAFLVELLPRILSEETTFQIFSFQGKLDLLSKLRARLRAYSHWLPESSRIVVLVDQDDDECAALKRRLEADAAAARLLTPSNPGGHPWQVVNRIAVEELEAWYFGDWNALTGLYPRVPANIPRNSAYRKPDAIQGGTWEALERILKRAGYFQSGIRKVELARGMGKVVDPANNTSPSFGCFCNALVQARA